MPVAAPINVSPELACAFVDKLIGFKAIGADGSGRRMYVPHHPEIRSFLEGFCRTPELPSAFPEVSNGVYRGIVVNGEAHPLVEFFEGVAAQLRAYVEGQAK